MFSRNCKHILQKKQKNKKTRFFYLLVSCLCAFVDLLLYCPSVILSFSFVAVCGLSGWAILWRFFLLFVYYFIVVEDLVVERELIYHSTATFVCLFQVRNWIYLVFNGNIDISIFKYAYIFIMNGWYIWDIYDVHK